jgi:hypothetical protein
MENSQLTIADLASIHSMLDAACSRGAFKAAEMAQVGQVYNKLSAFLETLRKNSEAETQAASQEPQAPQGDQNA